MTAHFVETNGIRIAYRIQGEGPPLLLVMGYRLSSIAWPAAFIDALAQRFTVITSPVNPSPEIRQARQVREPNSSLSHY